MPYRQDNPAISDSLGDVALVVRKDTGASLGDTDGDYVPLQVDASGNLRVNIASGSASITVSGAGTSSSFGSPVPASGTAAGFSDGTNMQAARVYDVNSGVGTEYAAGVVLRTTGASGSVELGTSTTPVRTDPTGTTIQPVSGTVTITNAVGSGAYIRPGTGVNLDTSAVTVTGALPTGTNTIGTVNVATDVASSISGHGSMSAGTAAAQMTSTSTVATKGVLVKAAAANAGKVYIGSSSSVTANTSASTDGIELSAGESVTLPVNNANLIYAIASQATQTIFFMAI